MAKLKKKSTEEVSENITDIQEETSEYMNDEEKEVLEKQGEETINANSKVSSEKMQAVIDLLQKDFNLKDKNFELTGYTDKGNKIVCGLTNSKYEVVFTLKDQETLMRLNLN